MILPKWLPNLKTNLVKSLTKLSLKIEEQTLFNVMIVDVVE